mmetsp:Transcript_1080/g.2409  ORF Transcript_1080/g.2409 Transcript_1080/m.2409 type:complete len:340 (-) Transcript_1080:1097-2116(-)
MGPFPSLSSNAAWYSSSCLGLRSFNMPSTAGLPAFLCTATTNRFASSRTSAVEWLKAPLLLGNASTASTFSPPPPSGYPLTRSVSSCNRAVMGLQALFCLGGNALSACVAKAPGPTCAEAAMISNPFRPPSLRRAFPSASFSTSCAMTASNRGALVDRCVLVLFRCSKTSSIKLTPPNSTCCILSSTATRAITASAGRAAPNPGSCAISLVTISSTFCRAASLSTQVFENRQRARYSPIKAVMPPCSEVSLLLPASASGEGRASNPGTPSRGCWPAGNCSTALAALVLPRKLLGSSSMPPTVGSYVFALGLMGLSVTGRDMSSAPSKDSSAYSYSPFSS